MCEKKAGNMEPYIRDAVKTMGLFGNFPNMGGGGYYKNKSQIIPFLLCPWLQEYAIPSPTNTPRNQKIWSYLIFVTHVTHGKGVNKFKWEDFFDK